MTTATAPRAYAHGRLSVQVHDLPAGRCVTVTAPDAPTMAECHVIAARWYRPGTYAVIPGAARGLDPRVTVIQPL